MQQNVRECGKNHFASVDIYANSFEQLFAGVSDFMCELFYIDGPLTDGNVGECSQHTTFACLRAVFANIRRHSVVLVWTRHFKTWNCNCSLMLSKHCHFFKKLNWLSIDQTAINCTPFTLYQESSMLVAHTQLLACKHHMYGLLQIINMLKYACFHKLSKL